MTAVIDGGLARVARFDPHRGINTLLVEKISAASADQRAGRAGRTAPGVCVRLWTEREHGLRMPQELPEVKRLDLAEVVLTLKASGIEDVFAFPWLEKPEPRALERAEMLLVDLGALAMRDVGGVPSPRGEKRGEGTPPTIITEIGRKMLRFPVHPRYARMFLAAEERGCVRSVALMAALTQGRSFLIRGVDKRTEEARDDLLGEETESDFFLLMRAWRYADQASYGLEACRRLGIHAQGARQVGPLFEQFLGIAEKEGLDVSEKRIDGAAVRKCVLAGFRTSSRAGSTAARSAASSSTVAAACSRARARSRKPPCFVAAEISEIGRGDGEVNTLAHARDRD